MYYLYHKHFHVRPLFSWNKDGQPTIVEIAKKPPEKANLANLNIDAFLVKFEAWKKSESPDKQHLYAELRDMHQGAGINRASVAFGADEEMIAFGNYVKNVQQSLAVSSAAIAGVVQSPQSSGIISSEITRNDKELMDKIGASRLIIDGKEVKIQSVSTTQTGEIHVVIGGGPIALVNFRKEGNTWILDNSGYQLDNFDMKKNEIIIKKKTGTPVVVQAAPPPVSAPPVVPAGKPPIVTVVPAPIAVPAPAAPAAPTTKPVLKNTNEKKFENNKKFLNEHKNEWDNIVKILLDSEDEDTNLPYGYMRQINEEKNAGESVSLVSYLQEYINSGIWLDGSKNFSLVVDGELGPKTLEALQMIANAAESVVTPAPTPAQPISPAKPATNTPAAEPSLEELAQEDNKNVTKIILYAKMSSAIQKESVSGSFYNGKDFSEIDYAVIKQSDGEYYIFDKPDGEKMRKVYRTDKDFNVIGVSQVNHENHQTRLRGKAFYVEYMPKAKPSIKN